MAGNDDDGPSKPSKTMRDLKRVEDFYARADRMQEGFSEPDSPEYQIPQIARTRLALYIAERSQVSEKLQITENKDWMVYVLADLARYASDEGLDKIGECIENAQQNVQDLLDAEREADGAAPPESSQDDS